MYYSAGGLSIIRKFIESGEYGVDDKNDEGDTGLICAAYHNHINMAKLLIEAGATE